MVSQSSKRQQTYLILIIANLLVLSTQIAMNDNSVYTIPYLRSYLPQFSQQSLGCKYSIAYASYTVPDGLRDAAQIISNPYQYGGMRCQPKQTYLKIFGYAQNYDLLRDANSIVDGIKRSLNGKTRTKIIVDWKFNEGDLSGPSAFLDSLLESLENAKHSTYLKVPASYLCKSIAGKPYILSLKHATRIIVQMYGQQPTAYKTVNQIFTSITSDQTPSSDYPQANCPKFPSYALLKQTYPSVQFYIQKTLQQEVDGYIGDQIQNMLKSVPGIYNGKIFYDSYPPNIIRI